MNLFGKNKKAVKISSFQKIERKRVLKGRFIPAVINNGGSHFFINLPVYEDGLIDCWEMVDLDLFKAKLNSGWVSPIIPNGKALSIHHLGSWEVKSGTWLFDKDSFYQHVKNVLIDLNPDLTNLYNCHGITSKKIGKVNVSIFGISKGVPVRKEDEASYFSKEYRGDHFHAFVRQSELVFDLVNISVFEDSILQIAGIKKPELLSIAEFEDQVQQRKITSTLPEGATVNIYGLGKYIVGACQYAADIQQKTLEIRDMIAEMKGEKTTSEVCREIYDEYCASPTLELKEALKKAYENIPEHLRTYILGDMDVKDIPVRMIIYGEEEIENWSHYAVSKDLGKELPHINIPKPEDE